jgi:hypothetical protein
VLAIEPNTVAKVESPARTIVVGVPITADDESELPAVETARTLTVYDVLFVNPVTVSGDRVEAGDRVTQLAPLSREY